LQRGSDRRMFSLGRRMQKVEASKKSKIFRNLMPSLDLCQRENVSLNFSRLIKAICHAKAPNVLQKTISTWLTFQSAGESLNIIWILVLEAWDLLIRADGNERELMISAICSAQVIGNYLGVAPDVHHLVEAWSSIKSLPQIEIDINRRNRKDRSSNLLTGFNEEDAAGLDLLLIPRLKTRQ